MTDFEFFLHICEIESYSLIGDSDNDETQTSSIFQFFTKNTIIVYSRLFFNIIPFKIIAHVFHRFHNIIHKT